MSIRTELKNTYSHTYIYFYRPLRTLPLSRMNFEFSLKPVYLKWLGKIFKFMVFKLLGMHLRIKKLHLGIFIHAQHWQNSFPVSYYYPLAEENYSFLTECLFENLFSLQQKLGKRNYGFYIVCCASLPLVFFFFLRKVLIPFTSLFCSLSLFFW